jgi:hypothetical protein
MREFVAGLLRVASVLGQPSLLGGYLPMPLYARYEEFKTVRLKQDRASISDHPFTFLETPRPVTRSDRGVIMMVHDVERPGYEVEFFDLDDNTIDLLTLREDEIEPW